MTRQLNFSNSVTISVNFGFSPNNQPDFTANLTGESTLLFSDPIDALVDDPLLGNAKLQSVSINDSINLKLSTQYGRE